MNTDDCNSIRHSQKINWLFFLALESGISRDIRKYLDNSQIFIKPERRLLPTVAAAKTNSSSPILVPGFYKVAGLIKSNEATDVTSFCDCPQNKSGKGAINQETA